MTTYDLFLFAGQSNMAGRGIACTQFPEGAPDLISGAGAEFRAISDPTRLYPIAEPFGALENNPTGIFEPGMKTGSLVTSFVNTYFQNTGVPVLGLSSSKGGSVIANWQDHDDYLTDTITRLKSAQTFCEQHNITLRHQYLLWCQGESDGDHHTSADEYTKQFMQMYEKLKAVGIEHCFLIGIGAYNGTADDICYDEIRNAQYSFAEHRKDITVVSRLFETMKARGLMKDSFHYYQAGYNEVVLVYKCRQKKLNSLYYKKKEQRRCSTWRKIKNRILRNSSSRSSISTMPEVPHILNWNMNMA